nr:hypothetical protein [Methylomonas koyamae]
MVRVKVEQHAVFEGARFALVGIANHVARRGGLLRAAAPLQCGFKPGAAAAAQMRGIQFGQSFGEAAGETGLDRRAVYEGLV